MSTLYKIVKKLFARSRVRVALATLPVVLLLLITPMGTVIAVDDDNFDDLWESSIGQYEKLFPMPEMLYMFVVMVLSLGTYMKTNSLGAVTALLVIGGVFLATGVGDLGMLVFGFFTIISFAFLIYMAYRRR